MERYNFFKRKEEERRQKINRHDLITKKRETRFDHRSQVLDGYRQIHESPQIPIPAPSDKKTESKKSRLELLKEWKAEKEKKIMEAKQKKKPAFIAGVVHYKPNGSPKIPLKNITNSSVSVLRSGVKTRSQMKNAMSTVKKTQKKERPLKFEFKKLNKMEEKSFQPVRHHQFEIDLREKLTVPVSPRITKSSRKMGALGKRSECVNPLPKTSESDSNLSKRFRKSLFLKNGDSSSDQTLPRDVEVPSSSSSNAALKLRADEAKPKCDPPIPNFEARETLPSNRVDLLMDSSNESDDTKKRALELEAIMYSPFIEKKRGKTVPRTLDEKIQDEINKEGNMKKSTIATFKLFLMNETARLTELAEKWKGIALKSEIPADVVGEIDVAKGMTRLLTTDKFKQFAGLIDKFEAGDPNIRIGDLQGFHDWINLEVVDMDNVFSQLQQRRDNNWVVPPLVSPRLAKPKSLLKVQQKTTVKKAAGPSSLRAHILAQRQKLLQQNEQNDVITMTVAHVKQATPRIANSKEVASQYAEAMILSPQNVEPITRGKDRPKPPINQSLTSTKMESPSRTLYKSALTRRFSGLEVVAASARARASLTPTNFPAQKRELTLATSLASPAATPRRSILKKVSTPVSTRKMVGFAGVTGGLDIKYLLPAEETPSDQSPVIITMLAPNSDGTPTSSRKRRGTPLKESATPTRRSERIAKKLGTPHAPSLR